MALALAAFTSCAPPVPPPVEPTAEPRPAAPGPARPEPAAAIDLPLRQLETAHIVVPVILGAGKPLDFILDTGASLSVITPGTRDALGLDPGSGTPAAGSGAGGKLGDIRIVVLDRLQVGGHDYDQHTVAVMDLAHLETKLQAPIGGILGRNFLERHIIDLDFALKRLRMSPEGAEPPADPSLRPVPFAAFDAGGLIKIDVALDGAAPMPAVLDLGAGRSVLNWKAAAAAGVKPGHEGLRPSPEPLLGADNKPMESAYFRFKQVVLGPLTFADPELFMADLPVFETLGIADGPAMVFGVDMFRGRRLVLDYPRRRLLVSAAPG